MAPVRFTLYSRPGCGLCEEMLQQLQTVPQAVACRLDLVDIDSSPALLSRYGHKIPVLLLEGELVCHGHLDLEELHKALAYHRRPV